MEFYIFVYKACAVSLYTILVREVDGRFVTLFFNMSQNDLKRPNRILLIFSAIHIKSLAFRFATPIIYPGKISQADTFRIGNIGDVFPEDFSRLIEAIKTVAK